MNDTSIQISKSDIEQFANSFYAQGKSALECFNMSWESLSELEMVIQNAVLRKDHSEICTDLIEVKYSKGGKMKTQFKVGDKTMRLSSNDNQFTLCELVEVTNKESKSFGEVQERNHRYFPKLDQVARRLIHIGVDGLGELDLQDFPEMMDSLVKQICNSIEAGK
jgi:hypothetical protein